MPGFQKTNKMDQQMVDFFNQVEKRLKSIEDSFKQSNGISKIVVIPKLTPGGNNGKITIKNGVIIDAIDPT